MTTVDLDTLFVDEGALPRLVERFDGYARVQQQWIQGGHLNGEPIRADALVKLTRRAWAAEDAARAIVRLLEARGE